MLLTEDSNLYSLGSNQYGQLGILQSEPKLLDKGTPGTRPGSSALSTAGLPKHRDPSRLTQFDAEDDAVGMVDDAQQDLSLKIRTFEHPITCETVSYSPDPVQIHPGYFEDPIKQVVAGDNHTLLLTQKGQVYSWGLANDGQLGVTRQKGMINKLLVQNGVQFSPCPITIDTLSGKRIERLYTKNSMCYAYSAKGKIYNWGHMPRGLSLKPYDVTVDIPEKNAELAGYAFRDISISLDSATAIARSVQLTFTIPEMEDDDEDASYKGGYGGGGRKPAEDTDTVVTVHAIPVYDGSLVRSEVDLAEYLQENGDLVVELVNDFELPWVQKKLVRYPRYKNLRRRRRTNEDGEEDDDEDPDDDGDGEDQQEDEEEDEPSEDEDKSQSAKSQADSEADADPDEEEEKKKVAKKGKKKKRESEEMTELEKREQAALIFKNRLP